MNLGGNGLASVPQKALSILDMLRKLEMQENKISEIHEGDFAGRSIPDGRKKLYTIFSAFHHRRIVTDISFSPSGLKNLDSLGLAHNKLKVVPARVFSHLTLLNSLELDGNNINQIDPEAFYGLEGW